MMNTFISDALKKTAGSTAEVVHPRTGTVQSQTLWETETTESFVHSELYPVKLVNEQWMKVS